MAAKRVVRLKGQILLRDTERRASSDRDRLLQLLNLFAHSSIRRRMCLTDRQTAGRTRRRGTERHRQRERRAGCRRGCWYVYRKAAGWLMSAESSSMSSRASVIARRYRSLRHETFIFCRNADLYSTTPLTPPHRPPPQPRYTANSAFILIQCLPSLSRRRFVSTHHSFIYSNRIITLVNRENATDF